jgi:Ser/Thr protein kinase RdoA (MazF antagonist)
VIFANQIFYWVKRITTLNFNIKTLIDFGDINYSAAFYELIIACTRQVMFKMDPFRNMISVIKGYDQVIKL